MADNNDTKGFARYYPNLTPPSKVKERESDDWEELEDFRIEWHD